MSILDWSDSLMLLDVNLTLEIVPINPNNLVWAVDYNSDSDSDREFCKKAARTSMFKAIIMCPVSSNGYLKVYAKQAA